VNTSKALFLLFLVWLLIDVGFLAIGMWWRSLFGIGHFGLTLDFLFGIIILCQYLHENGKL